MFLILAGGSAAAFLDYNSLYNENDESRSLALDAMACTFPLAFLAIGFRNQLIRAASGIQPKTTGIISCTIIVTSLFLVYQIAACSAAIDEELNPSNSSLTTPGQKAVASVICHNYTAIPTYIALNVLGCVRVFIGYNNQAANASEVALYQQLLDEGNAADPDSDSDSDEDAVIVDFHEVASREVVGPEIVKDVGSINDPDFTGGVTGLMGARGLSATNDEPKQNKGKGEDAAKKTEKTKQKLGEGNGAANKKEVEITGVSLFTDGQAAALAPAAAPAPAAPQEVSMKGSLNQV